jgi:hypothetical protein
MVTASSFLGTQEITSATRSRNINNSCLKMGDASHKKATLEQSTLPSIHTSLSSRGDASTTPLTVEDGRLIAHRIDTKGSVQALVVNNGIIIAGLQDGTLAVSYHSLIVLRLH